MIALSVLISNVDEYFYYHKMEIFEKDEEARNWLYENFVDTKLITQWWDNSDNKGYMRNTPEDIKKVLDKYTLDEIVNKNSMNDIEIIIKRKKYTDRK